MCEMTEMTCCTCHIKHSIPVTLYNSSQGWTCPNGHSLIRSSKKTEVQDLKDEIARISKQMNIWMDATTNQRKRAEKLEREIDAKVATRIEVKRLKKKINAYKSTLKRLKNNGKEKQ